MSEVLSANMNERAEAAIELSRRKPILRNEQLRSIFMMAVIHERGAQINLHHWLPSDDDTRVHGELVEAACAHALASQAAPWGKVSAEEIAAAQLEDGRKLAISGDPLRCLITAAALLCAEYERIRRAGGPEHVVAVPEKAQGGTARAAPPPVLKATESRHEGEGLRRQLEYNRDHNGKNIGTVECQPFDAGEEAVRRARAWAADSTGKTYDEMFPVGARS